MDFNNIYAPIPDVDKYLEKLGVKAPETLNKEYLDNLIKVHQTRIPWGNIGVCVERVEISLEIPDIFDKVITRGREAYCMELNSLFYTLLKGFGYDIYACQAKVLGGEGPYVADHRGTIVRLDGKEYYGDVGFGGPMPAGLIELADGKIQQIHDDTYQLVQLDDLWWELRRQKGNGEWDAMIRLHQVSIDPLDFIPVNHYTCCHAQRMFNHFTDELLLNIRTEDGYASLTNNILKVKADSQMSERILHNEAEIGDVLIDIFHLPESIRELIAGKLDFIF